ncbi:pentapeptide repeat-containing protein [Sporosarcina limicola]|uniref:Pentapeptide repeat-containing protein n=1 Tax=Sporosarcina limicola TaxID=34101 RepID=A0A927MN54_9BACL|nr:pentapeptide repeat-containing protein [Sporosarcina limicola]MBE1555942.1 hypothetical protein [Sporosarcina limicola]
MHREEVLQHFLENEVEKRRIENLLALEHFFQTSKDELAEEFKQSFKKICFSIKEQQTQMSKAPLGHITFSMLRTELLEGNHTYIIEGTDEAWFFDLQPFLATYDASWAFRFLDQLITELNERSKTFTGVITQSDIERIKLKEAKHYHQYIISLARYALPASIICPEYQALEKELTVEIRVGEYMDVSEVVYIEDHTVKDSEEVKAWLNEKLDDEYPYEVFSDLNLSLGNYESMDLRYAFFQKSNVSYSRMRHCMLVGANLKACQLVESDLSFSLIYEADFSYSQLQGAIFRQAEGASGLPDLTHWEMPGYLPVRFVGANLEGADFQQANLQGACFVEATIKGVDFTGANLTGAMFSKEAREHLTLEPHQESSIIWK